MTGNPTSPPFSRGSNDTSDEEVSAPQRKIPSEESTAEVALSETPKEGVENHSLVQSQQQRLLSTVPSSFPTHPSLPYYAGVPQGKQSGNPFQHPFSMGMQQAGLQSNRMHPHNFHPSPDAEVSSNLFLGQARQEGFDVSVIGQGRGMISPNSFPSNMTASPHPSSGMAPRHPPYMQHVGMMGGAYSPYPYEIHVEDGRAVPHQNQARPWMNPPEWSHQVEIDKTAHARAFAPINHMVGKTDPPSPEPSQIVSPVSKSKKSKKQKDERFSWTDEIHQLFVECVETLADMATAKTVMTLMVAKGADPKRLTRIRVANHLQYHYSRKNKLSLSKITPGPLPPAKTDAPPPTEDQ